jgi:hypothetical protein
MPPPYQCLEADRLSRTQREQRLVEKLELVMFNCCLQLGAVDLKGFATQARKDLTKLSGTKRLLHRLTHVKSEIAANSASERHNPYIEAAHQHNLGTAPSICENTKHFDPVATGHL